MKPVKEANQYNAVVNHRCYTQDEYRELANIEGVDIVPDWDGLCVFFDYVEDMSVTLDPDGYYTTVAIMNSGETIYIKL